MLDSIPDRPGTRLADDADVDRGLVVRALDGDPRAFEELLERHQARVLRVVRLLGVRPEDREDVAQEVFVRVFRYLNGYRTRHAFAGWIYRVTVNAVHDHRGRDYRRGREEVQWTPNLEDSPLAAQEPRGGDQDLILRRRLEQALGVLSERERAVFVLVELEGLTTADVARSLGITTITVRRHLGRARRSLQKTLRDPDGE
ncbi:MAG TPA: RNA polymerase sigma factor [Candidatus Polarisedimenticolaceae bacterium]|nr:RNA polymerase sigma factor [Candidatus Polarisedimenticolaceae bacterium]